MEDEQSLSVTKPNLPVKVETRDNCSAVIKRMFAEPAERFDLVAKPPKEILPSFDSIYEIARVAQCTVQEFVNRDPDYALRLAENCCAEWQNILTTAAMKGSIEMQNEFGEYKDYALTKNQTRMIEIRVKEAQRQLDYVNELVLYAPCSEEKKRDRLLNSMYQRALRGDTRLSMYLIDRVEGRPAETKQVELDMDNARNVYLIIKTLFDKQLEVLNSGSGTKLICCSRRAGKTHLLVAILLIECLRKPRTKCMYIGETAELSEKLIDKAVNDIIDECDLRDSRGRRFDWKHIDNGSEIMVRGLSNTKDPDQIRGNAAKVIVIDEFFHLKSELLEYMQEQVLEPMQMDYADDYMFVCAGTPPQIKGTYGEHVWRTLDCEHFAWTWKDNPHPVSYEKRKQFIDEKLKQKGLDWQSPFARREYKGEWAYDDDLLLYAEYHTYNPEELIPTIKPTRIVFGIDYGVGDNDTIWGGAWNDDEARGYQFWEDKFNRLSIGMKGISQLEYLCQQTKKAWELALTMFPDLPLKEANKRILWDADDSDQHLTEYICSHVYIEYQERNEQGELVMKKLGLNIRNAHKTDKTIMYDRIRDVLRTGALLLIQDGKCAKEADSTVCKRGPNGEIYNEVDDKVYHPDLLPAMRYAMWNVIGMPGVE